VVIVLVIGPNVSVFKPDRKLWIFKGSKIPSATSFEGDVKPSLHVVRFYVKLKILAEYNRDTSFAKFKDISR
jgi:hypothetical protein